MPAVTDFQKYLSNKLSSSSDKEFFVLHNYFSYFCQPDEQISFELLQNFYRKVLLIPYWQDRLHLLQQALTESLSDFAGLHSWSECEPEDMAKAPNWQLIKIKQEKDLAQIIDTSLKKDLSTGDKIEIIPHHPEHVVAVVLKFDGQLKVSNFGPMAIIDNGCIEPLTSLSELHYLSSFQMSPSHIQILEDSYKGFICFRVKDNQWSGEMCRGNCWEKLENFKVKQAEEQPALFTQLKQLENLYIQPESDFHYQRLVQSLHEQYRQMLINENYSLLDTQLILSKARTAIRNLYPDNRLLILLTANIEFHAQKKQKLQQQQQQMKDQHTQHLAESNKLKML